MVTDVEATVGFLQRVPLFTRLSKRHLETLARRCFERSYKAGEVIVAQDKTGEGMFVIASGCAEVVRERGDGSRTVVNRFGPTDFFGELALLDEGVRTATVTAVEPTRCVALAKWDFLAELRQDPEMAVLILQELARRFRQALDAM